MANQWFKFYGAEYLADPKIGSLTAQERSIWITLLCISSTTETNGVIRFLDKEDLLTKSGIKFNPYDTDEWDKALNCLVTLERLNMVKVGEDGSIAILNWIKRQETAMTVAERVAKHREKKQEQAKCNGNVTDSVTNVTTEENRIEENRRESLSEREKLLDPKTGKKPNTHSGWVNAKRVKVGNSPMVVKKTKSQENAFEELLQLDYVIKKHRAMAEKETGADYSFLEEDKNPQARKLIALTIPKVEKYGKTMDDFLEFLRNNKFAREKDFNPLLCYTESMMVHFKLEKNKIKKTNTIKKDGKEWRFF